MKSKYILYMYQDFSQTSVFENKKAPYGMKLSLTWSNIWES